MNNSEKRIYLEGGKIVVVFPYDSNLVDICRDFKGIDSGVRYNTSPFKHWTIPERHLPEVVKKFKEFNFDFSDEIQLKFQNELKRLEEEKNRINLLEEIKSQKDIQVLNFPSHIKPDVRLYPHQRVTHSYLINSPKSSGCFHDQGLGKSLSALMKASDLIDKGEIEKVIVICPKSVKFTWAHEIETFTNFSYQVIEGQKWEREDQFESDVDIYILNYEMILSETENIKELLNKFNFLLILDEVHRTKSNKAKTTTKLHKEILPLTSHRLIMTGTLVPNKPCDVYWPMRVITQSGDFKLKYWDFVKKYHYLGNGFSPWSIGPAKKQLLPELTKQISNHTIRFLKSECIDLPPKIFRTEYADMDGEQTRLYNAFRKELYNEVSQMTAQEIRRSVQIILTKMLRLIQLASNPGLIFPEYSGNSNKLNLLYELVEDLVEGNKKVVVWSCFVKNIQTIFSHFQGKGYNPVLIYGQTKTENRQRAINSFQNDSSVKVIVCNPQAAKEGITLTDAQDAIYLDRNFNLVDYLQSQDRVHRISQEKTVTITNLVSRGTIDSYIDERLLNKKAMAQFIQGDIGQEEFIQGSITKTDIREILG